MPHSFIYYLIGLQENTSCYQLVYNFPNGFESFKPNVILTKTSTTKVCTTTDIRVTSLISFYKTILIWFDLTHKISFVFNLWLYFFMTLNLNYIKRGNRTTSFIHFEITRLFLKLEIHY